ncbi:unnamed protein product, partial [Mesorhabditis belari]|uniref:C-type lectin domain-containing protein n=1 Tax=Mesorhabditis belari TaxID=2138241 RepID=A0AAF3FG38_9BILA
MFFAVIAQNFSNRAPYIGVERHKNANVWTYSDGSPLTYQIWAQGEPNASGDKVCAIMSPENGQWKAAECSTDRPFFCTMVGHDGPCPPNWIYYAATKFCYYLQPFTFYDNVHWQLYNFDTAEARCKAMGAHPTSVHSAVENNFLFDIIASNVNASLVQAASDGIHSCWQQWAWIGLFGTGAKMNGYWTDGTPVDWTGVDPPNAQNYSYVVRC